MNITIVGGGNIGTQFAVHCAEKGHRVTVFSGRYTEFERELSIVNSAGEVLRRGKIYRATDDAASAFGEAEVVFVTVPAFLSESVAEKMSPYTRGGIKIVLVPGTGGGECAFKSFISRGCFVYGLQRVPSVARLVKYGKTVCAEGYRDMLYLGALPKSADEGFAAFIADLFGIPCLFLPCYLNLTLTPSNPVLHTSRLYSLFKDYTAGKTYPRVPLFYEEWDEATSKILLACDNEVQQICRALPCFDLSGVKSLKVHYESQNALQLTQKIRSIKAFKGIKTPMVEKDGMFAPDFSSRYFTADFAYGLSILRDIAGFLGLNIPVTDKLIDWYVRVSGRRERFDFSRFGITDLESFVKFYSL